MKRYLLSFCLGLFMLSAGQLIAQTVTLETVNNAVAGNVSVAITMSGFNQTTPSVSAFQWTVQFDNSKLSYLNVTPVTPLDGWTTHTPSAGRVTFVVVPSVSFNANSPTVICYMNFTYNGTASAFLNWSDNPTPRYIYDDNIDDYLTITWINGSVNPAAGIAPTIITHPASGNVCPGSGASFSVGASGTDPLSYQWQLSTNGGSSWSNQTNGGVYSGMSSATMNISAATTGMNSYRYRCFVSNSYGNTISGSATLTILSSVAISAQPQNQTVNVGGNASFSLTASGTAAMYQWQISTNGGANYSNLTNGGSNPAYSGVNTSTLSVSGCTSGMDNYRYRCLVNNSCNSATSNHALLTVLIPSSPFCVIDSVAGLNTQNVSVPVKMSGFDATAPGVSSFQWTIQYDTTKLNYINVTTLIPNNGWNIIRNGNKLTFNVSPVSGFNADAEVTVCNLNFQILGTNGCFDLSWTDDPLQRFVYDNSLNAYTGITWVDGKVCEFTTTSTGQIKAETEQLVLYPNPASSQLCFEIPQHGCKKIRVINLNGTTVYEAINIENSISVMEIDISGLKEGMYFLILIPNEGSQIRKRFTVIR